MCLKFFLSLLLALLICGSAIAQTSAPHLSQPIDDSSANIAPMTKDEVMNRVRSAHINKLDVDDIAADVDRRGIDFALDDMLANQIRFLRAVEVTNALYRADDRRKAIIAKPQKPESLSELSGDAKRDISSLPFIEQARAVALAYVASLPNFVVREQVQRYEHASASSWKLGDYLEIAVSYSFGHGEDVKLKLQNGKAAKVSLDEVGGLTSTGQFAGQLEMLFNLDSRTEFSDKGPINFYGKPCEIYGYRVETKNSHQILKVGSAQVTTGYRGQIYIDKETKQVLRLEEESIDIPYSFPISAASSIVDFGWVSIGGKDFLLPVSAQVQLTDKQTRFTALNCITFNKYGKFETDVKIVE
jgi:hypothetical protein